ncbi:MAG: DUF1223 domain-containing protein [Candidatus Sulfotelmatobacter sp.]
MRNFRLLLLGFVLFVAGSVQFPSRTLAQNAPADSPRRPIIVELFTSEGCSSCPPADILLQKLEAQQPVPGAEIIGLEEHVDYWNHDGWVDPYSSPEWTDRQQTYTSLIKKDPYSPELVVDGRFQFVGNNPREAVVEIQEAALAEKTEVSITPASVDAKSARFNVSVGKPAGDLAGDVAEVWLAVTEDGLHSAVSRGENAGRELNHVATLRWLHKIGVAAPSGATVSYTGEPVVKLNSHWNVENLHATIFVQKKKSRQIIGAASTKIKS